MLEDLFSNNIVDIPDDIERVVEGGEDEHNVSGNDSDKEEGKNTDDKDKDKIKIKRKLGPRPVLNAERLKGPRGIGIMEKFFADIKLKGKGQEKEDLELLMGRLEHWTHRLFPRMQFDDSLKKIEKLGSKKEIVNYVKRLRLGMEEESGTGEAEMDDPPDSPPTVDPFDQLLSPSSVPARPTINKEITADQRERMLRNRLIAEERRAARMKRAEEMKEKYQAEQTHSQPGDTEAEWSPDSQSKQHERIKVNNNTGSNLGKEVLDMNERCEIQGGISTERNENDKNIGQMDVSENPKYNLIEKKLDVHENQLDVLPEINECVPSNEEIVDKSVEKSNIEERSVNSTDPKEDVVPIENSKIELKVVSDNKTYSLTKCDNQSDYAKEKNGNPNDAKMKPNINQNIVLLNNQIDQQSITKEKNKIQSIESQSRTSVERNRSQTSVEVEGTHNQVEVLMDGTHNKPDMAVGTNNQLDVEEGTNNQPDVIEGTHNQPEVLMEVTDNQPDTVEEGE